MAARRRLSSQVDLLSGCPIRVRHLDDVIENDTAGLLKQEAEASLRYEHLQADQVAQVDKLLKGGIEFDNVPCLQPRVVRVFVCSTGPDFEAERNYIYQHVYPLIRRYCRDTHGVEFQLADMDWGVAGQPTSPTPTGQTRLKVLTDELEYCQDVSLGPNIVAFIGQKYGDVTAPEEILTSELESIKACLEEDDVSAIDEWYREDVNVTPHVFRLVDQEATSEDTDVNSKKKDVQNLILKGAQLCHKKGTLSDTDFVKYSVSDLEHVVRRGILDLPRESRDRRCVVFMRDIENIEEHLAAKNAETFLDILPSFRVDTERKERLANLKKLLSDGVCSDNVLNSNVHLNGSTLDENKSGDYIKNVGHHFYASITRLVDSQMSKVDPICEDPLCHEVAQHWSVVLQSSQCFVGREEILNTIKGYLLSDTEQPLVIQGCMGCGKTTTIAKAASDINEAIQNSLLSMPTTLLTRFIGETGQSVDSQQLLYYLCHQLAYVTGRYRQEIPTEYKGLKNYFIDLIQRGEYGGMIVILLDGLDLLTETDAGHKLDWLPSRIAANVKIVMTIDTECGKMHQRLANKVDGNIVQIPAFSSKDCENIFKADMTDSKRTVTYNQWKRVTEAFGSCTSPLFVKLVSLEARKWNSSEDSSSTSLSSSCNDMIRELFKGLEEKHGKLFVCRALGFLTASKEGLSESEIEDLLSLDDEVLNSVFLELSSYPAGRRIPPVVWAALRSDLLPYLQTREIDGIAVLTWRFNTMYKLASERYLRTDTDDTVAIYSTVADYFLGIWGGSKKKPFRHPAILMAKYKLCETEDKACRLVPEQPLLCGERERINKRKMSQLPPSLLLSQRYDDLKSAVFCNYEWLSCKLRAYSLQRLLTDFSLVDDRETSLVADALQMSKSALEINPKALGMELTGRLLPHTEKYMFVKELVYQCDMNAQKSCPLVPNFQIYSAPGGPLQYECDVGGNINCPIDIDVFTSPDGILLTAKPYYSNKLQVWELSSGDGRPDIMLPVGDVHPARDGRFINIIQNNDCIKTYKSDCGVLHGEVKFNQGKVADIDVANRYVAFSIEKGAGPYVVDVERSELLHKFAFHTHAVAISEEERYLAFNSERNVLLYEIPLMNRKCVAQTTDIAHDILFINESPKCYVMTKSKLVEAVTFDVINRKYTCKTVVSDLEARECIPSSTKQMLLVRCSRTLHLVDTRTDIVVRQFQKLPSDVFVDNSSTFSGAGFTPNDDMIVASRYTYLIVWSAVTGEPIRVLQTSVSPMIRLFTSDSVNKVVSLLENNSFQVWNLDNLDQDIHHSIEIHSNSVKSLDVSCASGYVVSFDSDIPEAKLVSLDTGTVVETLQHSSDCEDKIVQVQFSPDGLYVVTRAKLVEAADSSSNTTFEALTDDVMWEVESASQIFHAITNRFTVFSPNSELAAFVTCAFYNRHDWSENVYNVFVVHPETSSNHTIDFPYNTEFVAEPCITRKNGENFFVATIQTCKKTIDADAKKEISRCTEVLLLINRLSPSENNRKSSLLKLHNMTNDVGDNEKFLDAKKLPDGNILVVYAQDVAPYSFETDKGLLHPRKVAKGAILYDVANETSLKHMSSFLDPSSTVSSLLISSRSTVMVDSALRVFRFDKNASFQNQIKPNQIVASTARLCLDGRYVVGIAENRRNVLVIRTSDCVELGSVFVHGRATCLAVGEDDRTVAVGCQDGRVMIFSMILEFPDPLKEFIEKLPSRRGAANDENLIDSDIRYIANSTPDQHRLSARMRKVSSSESRRPPSYSTLHTAVAVSRQSHRSRNTPCIQQ